MRGSAEIAGRAEDGHVLARPTLLARAKTHLSVNDEHPWVLTAVYRDLGRIVSFKSPMPFHDPSTLHPVGSKVTVFYVPWEPKTYSIELDGPTSPAER